MVDLDDKLAEKVALSCNILDMGGHGNFTQGHVTAREPGQTYLHMKPRGLGLDEVTTRDIIVIDFDGNKLHSGRFKNVDSCSDKQWNN